MTPLRRTLILLVALAGMAIQFVLGFRMGRSWSLAHDECACDCFRPTLVQERNR